MYSPLAKSTEGALCRSPQRLRVAAKATPRSMRALVAFWALCGASVAHGFRAKPRLLRRSPLSASVGTPTGATSAGLARGSLAQIMDPAGAGGQQQLVFLGGKGGVGKTSTAAALGVTMADRGLSTLVLSTDPAHSLGDALGQDVGGGDAVLVQGTTNLYALEVDGERAVREFQEALEALDAKKIAVTLGLPEDVVAKLGLEDLAGVLNTTPPGLDELVSLAAVIDLAADAKYDRVVVDTAPTGHTLRLLSLPEFLDNLLTKLLDLRSRLEKIADRLRVLLTLVNGLAEGEEKLKASINTATEQLKAWQKKIDQVDEVRCRARFHVAVFKVWRARQRKATPTDAGLPR
eukprot:scaffold848_cov247-Pinguiococcus_pyrenoidosus.AAC.17